MAISCAILNPIFPCIGIDVHQVIIPATPPAYAPYFWLQVLGGLPVVGKAKKCDDVYTFPFSLPAMQKGTDIGKMIVHVGNPANIKLPFIILGSGSKSHFGSSTVKVDGETVGTACIVYVNINLNCCDPVNLPTGIVIAPSTTMAGMTLGDYIAGIVNMAVDIAVSYVVGKAVGKALGPLSRVSNGEIASIAPSLFVQTGKDAFKLTSDFVANEVASFVVKEGVDFLRGEFNEHVYNLDPDQIGDAIGSAVDAEPARSIFEDTAIEDIGDFPTDSNPPIA